MLRIKAFAVNAVKLDIPLKDRECVGQDCQGYGAYAREFHALLPSCGLTRYFTERPAIVPESAVSVGHTLYLKIAAVMTKKQKKSNGAGDPA